MTEPRIFRRYLGRLCLLTLAWLAAVAALNFTADPYVIWNMSRPGQISMAKPRTGKQVGLARIAQSERLQPATLLLGNSRVEVGLDPDSPQWPAAVQPVFNLSQAGYGTSAPILMLRHAGATRVPRQVVLAIDFIDFLGADPATPAERSALEKRTRFRLDGSPNPDYRLNKLKDAGVSLLSLSAVKDSFATLAAQFDPRADTMTAKGFNPLNSADGAARISGYSEIFQQKNQLYARRYSAPNLKYRGVITEGAFAQVAELIAYCADKGIDLVVYIHPYHADFLEILRGAGHWEAFEDWKRKMAGMLAGGGRPGGYPLWDFSGYHPVAVEAVPGPGDRSTMMKWYWEAGHYKRELGDLIIATLQTGTPPPAAAGMGRPLTRDSVEAVLSDIRAEQRLYHDTQPQAVERVRKLVEQARERR